jgi:hypothetical protein
MTNTISPPQSYGWSVSTEPCLAHLGTAFWQVAARPRPERKNGTRPFKPRASAHLGFRAEVRFRSITPGLVVCPLTHSDLDRGRSGGCSRGSRYGGDAALFEHHLPFTLYRWTESVT